MSRRYGTIALHQPRKHDASGQMTVELAVLMPVVIVVSLTMVNLGAFLVFCARFDRLAPDMVCAHGVASRKERGAAFAAQRVQAEIEQAFSASASSFGNVEIHVSATDLTHTATSDTAVTFPLSPLLTEFHCTLYYYPWPSSFVIAGVAFQSPLRLTHTRSITVDRFRPGVVV